MPTVQPITLFIPMATCMSSEGNVAPPEAQNQGPEVLLWLGPALS